jgi:AdoMet-dependent heme synthase
MTRNGPTPRTPATERIRIQLNTDMTTTTACNPGFKAPSAELEELTAARCIPLHAQVELTHRCNLRCVHCYLVPRNEPELETEEIANLLRELADMGSLFLLLTGGEPLVRPDFFDIVDHARKLGFAVRLLTNATLIDAKAARRIRQASIQEVGISLYGATARTHDTVTRARGSFERTIDGIGALTNAGVRVHVKCPLMTLNRHEAYAVQDLTERLGVRCMMDVSLTPKDDGDRAPLAYRIEGETLRATVADARLYGAGHASATDGAPPRMLCDAGRNLAGVSPYGDVWPCVQLKEIAGNLRRDSLRRIWNDAPEFKRLRAMKEEDAAECTACADRQFCARCEGIARLEDGDLLAPSKRSCKIAQIFKEVRYGRNNNTRRDG